MRTGWNDLAGRTGAAAPWGLLAFGALVAFGSSGVLAVAACGSDTVIKSGGDEDGDDPGPGEDPGGGEEAGGGEGGAPGPGPGDPPGDVPAGPFVATPPPVRAYVASGSFGPLGAYQGISGKAQLVRHADGTSEVQLHIEGLGVEKAYPAHLHTLPCAYAGGPHYKLDPSIEETAADNEIWPGFTTDAGGVGRATVSTPHAVRPDGQAVIVHDPDGDNAKMACADLWVDGEDGFVRQGPFRPFAAAEGIDAGITGSASMTVDDAGAALVVDVTGLKQGTDYVSHVHTLPCAVAGGGPHYLMDPDAEGGAAENEIWPWVAAGADGGSATRLQTPHAVRPDAQSVVIHRVAGADTPKVACADLVRPSYPDRVATGTSTLLQAGTDKGYADAAATATVTRSIDGGTTVELSLAGLPADQTYPAHVHEYSCALASGGGHYVKDPAAPGGEDNEIWPSVTVDATGAGTKTVSTPHLARPEAQSIVVHDYDDGARILCIDLG